MFDQKMMRSRTLLVVLVLALAVAGFAPSQATAAPAAQAPGLVELREIIADPNQYENQIVTVAGEVANMPATDHLFVLRAEDQLRLDQFLVLGSSDLIADLAEGDRVLVTGTVQTYSPEFAETLDFEIDEQISNAMLGRSVLVADSIQDPGEVELAEDVVVRIGDRTITQGEFDEWFFDMINVVAARRGIPLNEQTIQIFEGLRREFLQQMVAEQVLLEEAARRGIQVGEEDVQIRIDRIRDQFDTPEAYMEALQQAGFADEEGLRNFIRNSLVLQLVAQAVVEDTPITEEEVRQFFEENPNLFRSVGGATLQFDVAEPQIRRLLEQQRFQERLNELQEQSGVEFFVDSLAPMDTGDTGAADLAPSEEITGSVEITGTGTITP